MTQTPSAYNRQTVLEILHAREANVKFEKVNGDIRKMRCTLKYDLLPEMVQERMQSESMTEHKRNPDVMTVYDLDADGWRSFHLSSVIEIL